MTEKHSPAGMCGACSCWRQKMASLEAEAKRLRTAIDDHRHNTRTAMYTEQEHINRVLWEALEESST